MCGRHSMRKRNGFGWFFHNSLYIAPWSIPIQCVGLGNEKKNWWSIASLTRFFPKQFNWDSTYFYKIFVKMVIFFSSVETRQNFKHFVHDSKFVAFKCLPRLSGSHLCLLPPSISMGLSDEEISPGVERLQWRLTKKLWKSCLET